MARRNSDLLLGKAAQALKVFPKQILDLERRGLITPVRQAGGQRRYRMEELRRYLRSGDQVGNDKPDSVRICPECGEPFAAVSPTQVYCCRCHAQRYQARRHRLRKQPSKIKIGRFDGDWATLEWRGATFSFPRGLLPDGAKEGDMTEDIYYGRIVICRAEREKL